MNYLNFELLFFAYLTLFLLKRGKMCTTLENMLAQFPEKIAFTSRRIFMNFN